MRGAFRVEKALLLIPGLDLPGFPNGFGPLDLGAYETQSLCGGADTIFCATFE